MRRDRGTHQSLKVVPGHAAKNHLSRGGQFRVALEASNGQKHLFPGLSSAAAAYRLAWGAIFRPVIANSSMIGKMRGQRGARWLPWMSRLKGILVASIYDDGRRLSTDELNRLEESMLASAKLRRKSERSRIDRLDAQLASMRPTALESLDLGEDV